MVGLASGRADGGGGGVMVDRACESCKSWQIEQG